MAMYILHEGEELKIRIRKKREESGMTQQQVADYLFCDQSLYSKYERGEREVPFEIMVKLAKLFGTSIDYLAKLTDTEEPYR